MGILEGVKWQTSRAWAIGPKQQWIREPKALSLETSSGEAIGFCCWLDIFWFSLGSTRLSQYCDYGNLFQCFPFCSHDVPPVFLLDNVPPLTSLTPYINSDHVKDKDKTEIRRQTQRLQNVPPPHLTHLLHQLLRNIRPCQRRKKTIGFFPQFQTLLQRHRCLFAMLGSLPGR